MKSYKTGRQRRTNKQKLKRTKAALALRQAQREASERLTYDPEQNKYVEVPKRAERRSIASRWARLKKWVGGLFVRRKKPSPFDMDYDYGQNLGSRRFLRDLEKQ